MVPETTHSQPGGASETTVEMAPGIQLESTEAETEPHSRPVETRPISAASRVRLDRMERTILYTRIAALERALEARDRQRAAIIDRYETVLADLEQRATDETVEIEFENDTTARDSLLERLHSLFGRR